MSERNKALTRRFYQEVLTQKNLQVLDELCAPGIVDHSAIPGQEPGRQGLRSTIEEYLRAFPDMNVTVHEVVAEGDVVAVRLTGQGTHTGAFLGSGSVGPSSMIE
jgi:predicted ester cyclase